MATPAHCLPLLIVFDLDYTLWPFYADTHITPPFKKKDGKVFDAKGGLLKPYDEAEAILKTVYNLGIKIGVASRTHEPDIAKKILDLFGWTKYITYVQIFTGWKIPHFQQMHKQSKIDYSKMIFFDDEDRNIRDIRTLGVFCVPVPNGITTKLYNNAMKEYSQRCKDAVTPKSLVPE